nr:aminodeoxychorismate/anthranilate synthase component II [Bacteroidota bacterium]
MRIFLVDNHDSFTYNLVNMLRKVSNLRFDIYYPEQVDIKNIEHYDKILFSPGPDIPVKGDIMYRIIDTYGTSKSMLGVCLGFQAICLYFGATLENMQTVVHGKSFQTNISLPVDKLFYGIPDPFRAGLYHSWRVSSKSFPEVLRVTAKSVSGTIMAVSHNEYDIKGFQFHPESILTPEGEKIIMNWLEIKSPTLSVPG